jgi:hypothetical protein
MPAQKTSRKNIKKLSKYNYKKLNNKQINRMLYNFAEPFAPGFKYLQ